MDNYTEWRQNKLYEGHINRLRNIHDATSPEATAKFPLKMISVKHQRSKTEGSSLIRKTKLKTQSKNPNNSSPNNPNNSSPNQMYFPAPLLPGQEGQLVQAALSSKTIPLKSKEQMLENYLLGRRILSARTVLNTREDEKSFKFHQRLSRNMSRSQKVSQAYSSERQQSTHPLIRIQ